MRTVEKTKEFKQANTATKKRMLRRHFISMLSDIYVDDDIKNFVDKEMHGVIDIKLQVEARR